MLLCLLSSELTAIFLLERECYLEDTKGFELECLYF